MIGRSTVKALSRLNNQDGCHGLKRSVKSAIVIVINKVDGISSLKE